MDHPIHPTTPTAHHDLTTPDISSGRDALCHILELARNSTNELISAAHGTPTAACTRIRGTGPGVSFAELVCRLETDHPINLAFPFEGSARVGGAVWLASDLLDPGNTSALAKLHWKSGARDLPMHVHTRSDRFIIVLEGRGFFHVSDQGLDRFDGSSVQTVAARERDVFLFTRDVVHTFSTAEHAMTLLSAQLPFIPFDDATQYALPEHRWTAAEHLDPADSRVRLMPGWTSLV